MKKLIILLLFIPIVSFGQENTLNLNIKEIKNTDMGIFPRGGGEFIYQSYMVGNGRRNPSFERAYERIQKYADERNVKYEQTNSAIFKVRNTIKINFKLFYEDGTVYLLKDEILKELRSLKELLDLGVITQEEFDKKANIYKQVFIK